jgi:hypothetical protein
MPCCGPIKRENYGVPIAEDIFALLPIKDHFLYNYMWAIEKVVSKYSKNCFGEYLKGIILGYLINIELVDGLPIEHFDKKRLADIITEAVWHDDAAGF